MNKSNINELSAKTKADSNSAVENQQVSQPNANTNVVGSAFILTDEKRKEITKISKQFAGGFKDTFRSINNTGYLIVDPLSAYLNSIGFENKLDQMPANDKHPMVLIITFGDGSKFIPSGADLKRVHPEFKNWMWF